MITDTRPGSRQPRSNGPDRTLHRLCRLLIAQALHVDERQGNALVIGKVIQRLLDALPQLAGQNDALGVWRMLVGPWRLADLFDQRVHRGSGPPAASAPGVVAGVDHNTEEPALE